MMNEREQRARHAAAIDRVISFIVCAFFAVCAYRFIRFLNEGF